MLERFFDEVGGMQLVVHSPYGSRLNRAWGLALRKRFCRKFNFELQAAATEDNIVLSLTTAHSFDLDDVKRYLNSATVKDVLVQALLQRGAAHQLHDQVRLRLVLARGEDAHDVRVLDARQRARLALEARALPVVPNGCCSCIVQALMSASGTRTHRL